MSGRRTNVQIETLARPLFPKYGLHDVGGMVTSAVHYRINAGHVKIDRNTGRWSWFASSAMTSVTPSHAVISFPADFRRNAAAARDRIYRAISDLVYDDHDARFRCVKEDA